MLNQSYGVHNMDLIWLVKQALQLTYDSYNRYLTMASRGLARCYTYHSQHNIYKVNAWITYYIWNFLGLLPKDVKYRCRFRAQHSHAFSWNIPENTWINDTQVHNSSLKCSGCYTWVRNTHVVCCIWTVPYLMNN